MNDKTHMTGYLQGYLSKKAVIGASTTPPPKVLSSLPATGGNNNPGFQPPPALETPAAPEIKMPSTMNQFQNNKAMNAGGKVQNSNFNADYNAWKNTDTRSPIRSFFNEKQDKSRGEWDRQNAAQQQQITQDGGPGGNTSKALNQLNPVTAESEQNQFQMEAGSLANNARTSADKRNAQNAAFAAQRKQSRSDQSAPAGSIASTYKPSAAVAEESMTPTQRYASRQAMPNLQDRRDKRPANQRYTEGGGQNSEWVKPTGQYSAGVKVGPEAVAAMRAKREAVNPNNATAKLGAGHHANRVQQYMANQPGRSEAVMNALQGMRTGDKLSAPEEEMVANMRGKNNSRSKRNISTFVKRNQAGNTGTNWAELAAANKMKKNKRA